MENNYFAGAVHNDNHKEQNITINGNVTGSTISKLAETFFCDAEEVKPLEEPRHNIHNILNTPEAQTLWRKAIDNGWVDNDMLPTRMLPTKTAKAVFANVFADMLRMDNPIYPPFEEIWNIRDLQNSYSSGMQFEKNKTLKDEIQKSLR